MDPLIPAVTRTIAPARASGLFAVSNGVVLYHTAALAVMLAALYGPFQVVGRVIEMRFGHRFDARITGMIAFMCGPIAMLLVQADNLGNMILVALRIILIAKRYIVADDKLV